MLWVKAFHIVFMVTWFAGLFYLPRLFVYHAMSDDKISDERFKIMERKLYYGITTPGAILTTLLGIILFMMYPTYYFHAGWMHLKLTAVVLLWIYHIYCGVLVQAFKNNRNQHTHVFYRWLNELPLLFLIVSVVCVVVRPF